MNKLILFIFVFCLSVVVYALPNNPPPSPGCGTEGLLFDNDRDGTYPDTCTDVTQTIGSDTGWNVEDADYVGFELVVDTAACGGDFLRAGSDTAGSWRTNPRVVEMKTSFPTTDARYFWVRHRNTGSQVAYFSVSNTAKVVRDEVHLSYLPDTQGQWRWDKIYDDTYTAQTEIQKSFTPAGTGTNVARLWVMGEADIDAVYSSVGAGAIPDCPSGTSGGVSDMTAYQYTSITVNGSFTENEWANAQTVVAPVLNTSNNAITRNQVLWNDTANRICRAVEITDASIAYASPELVNDGDVLNDDGLEDVIAITKAIADTTVKVGVNYAGTKYDADFNAFPDLTANQNIASSCATTASGWKCEYCYDLPFNPAPGDIKYFNSKITDIDAGVGGKTQMLACSTGINALEGMCSIKFVSDNPDPPPPDSISPTYGGTSEANITPYQADIVVSAIQDNSGNPVSALVKYTTIQGNYTNALFSNTITVVSGDSATIRVPKIGDATLLPSTRYYYKAELRDEVGNLTITAEDFFDTLGIGTTLYISPSGTDTGACTNSASPCKTFTYVDSLLDPGEILVLRDGTYSTAAGTGLPVIDCSTANWKNGEPGKPITIKAENERQALLSSTGATAALRMTNCSWWNVEGLRGRGADLSSANGGNGYSVFHFDNVHNVNIRRVLVTHPNRYFNDHALLIADNSLNVLLEESEAYYYHRWGLVSYSSERITFRRLYSNSRSYADLAGSGYSSIKPTTGDFALGFYGTADYKTNQSIIENCIGENANEGIPTGNSPTNPALANKVFGTISLNNAAAGITAGGYRRSGTEVFPQHNTYLENIVSVNNGNHGFWDKGAYNTQVKNATLYNNAGSGLNTTNTIGSTETKSIFMTNVLSFNNNNKGFNIAEKDSWQINYSDSYGNNDDWNPDEANISDNLGNIRYSVSVNPTFMGTGQNQCIVYVPGGNGGQNPQVVSGSNSNQSGNGENGEDRGANIIYRYHNGVLQDGTGGTIAQTLWNQTTGQFPCGATVEGINDHPNGGTTDTNACINVHKRLNVGVNGCPIPTGGAQPQADLSVSLTDFPDPAVEGNNATWTATVDNTGQTGSNTTLTITFDSTLVDHISSDSRCTYNNADVLTCALGTINPEGITQVQFVGRPKDPAGGGTVTVTALVTGSAPEFDSSNNSDSEITTVENPEAPPANLFSFEAEDTNKCTRTGVTQGVDGAITYIDFGTTATNQLECTVTVPQTGNYYCWYNASKLNTGSDSFHWINSGDAEGDATSVHFLDLMPSLTGSWYWAQLTNGAFASPARRTLSLTVGPYTFVLKRRESGFKLDSVVCYYNDEDQMPQTANVYMASTTPAECDINGTGCTGVVVKGENFTPTPAIAVGTGQATGESLNADGDEITSTFPTQTTAGSKNVTVTNPNGTVGTGTFNYTDAGAGANTFYVAPNGLDTNPGTSALPWRTLTYALQQLDPGETLRLKNGTWTNLTSCTGLPTPCLANAALPNVDCNLATYNDGTPTGKITVTWADNERGALLRSNGSAQAFKLINCEHWNIEGLRMMAQNNTSNPTSRILWIDYGSNINLKRNLVTHPNTYHDGAPFFVSRSNNVLVEENEVYYFHRHGINGYGSSNLTYRRNYVNSRNYTCLGSGTCGGAYGDEGLSFYPANNSLAENNICEYSDECFTSHANGTANSGDDNGYYGNIAMNGIGARVFFADSRCEDSPTYPTCDLEHIMEDGWYENNVSYNSGSGFSNLSATRTVFQNNSAINATGLWGFNHGPRGGHTNVVVSFINNLATGDGGGTGFNKDPTMANTCTYTSNLANNFTTNLSISGCTQSGNLTTSPNAGLTCTSSNTPCVGSGANMCVVYIPAANTNLKGTGSGGSDIGANIVYRYQDGSITGTKLWNQTTGQFPCGATVNDVNTNSAFSNSAATRTGIADSACVNAHKELAVGVNGCAIP